MRGDNEHIDLVAVLDHPPTSTSVAAERSLLRVLEGGCHAPIAAWGRLQDAAIHLDGLVGRPDGTLLLRATISGPIGNAEALGEKLAEELRAQGADDILADLESE